MKVRQLSRLAELSTTDRIGVVAEGLQEIAESVRALRVEREQVHGIAPRASLLLKTLATEEAAKGYMLVDYLRPPKDTSEAAVAAHLSRVYDHVARGVYGYYYDTRPASFGEVMEIVESERVSLYLDGPEGFEWIYRNSIMQRREEAMYVDWVEMEGEMHWQSPAYTTRLAEGMPLTHPSIVDLLPAMEEEGLLVAESLAALRDVWQTKTLTPDTSWMECVVANGEFLDALRAAGTEVSDRAEALVERRLLFPLTSLDTSMQKVDRNELEETRDEAIRNWNPW